MNNLGLTVACALLAVGLAGCDRGAQSQTTPPASRPTTQQAAAAQRVKTIPWLEVNSATREEMETAITGLRVGQKVTDTAITTTTVGRLHIYPRLRERVPGMHIIPGVKTAGYCDPFDSLAGWRTIADEVTRLCKASGELRVVLENETALADKSSGGKNNYRDAKFKLDFERLKTRLSRLPKGVEIWWCPSFASGGAQPEVEHRQSEALCRLVQEVCDTRFVTADLAKPPDRNDWWDADCARLRDAIAKKPGVAIIYFYWSGPRHYWTYDRVIEALSQVRGPDAIIYPEHWVEAAEGITRVLEPARKAERS